MSGTSSEVANSGDVPECAPASPPSSLQDSIAQFEEIASIAAHGWADIIEANDICQIYLGGAENQYIPYPFRLASAGNITQRIRNVSVELIIDSNISDPDITNTDVIETAIEMDAEYVIPKDYAGQIEATHQSLRGFLNIYDDKGCRSKIIVPIQPPHDRHFFEYENFLDDFSHFAIGGVRDKHVHEQIAAVEGFRTAAGDGKWVHGLGMGTSPTMIQALLERDPFLDSLDNTRFETMPGRYNKFADRTWNATSFDSPGGADSSKLRSFLSAYLVYQLNHQLAHPEETEFWGCNGGGVTQTSLGKH